jgi:hypothetical protein
MADKDGAEGCPSVLPEEIWPELNFHLRSQVIAILLQTAFEVVTNDSVKVLTDEANDRPKDHNQQSPRASH